MVDAEAIHHGTGTVLSSLSNSKVQTVFSKAKSRRQSNDSAASEVLHMKDQLKGSKFKQSEMLGFRKVGQNLNS